MRPIVLTVDIGTQSLRAVLVDTEGNLLNMVQDRFEKPYFSPQPNWAEQRADFYWERLCKACRKLRDESGELWQRLKGVSVTTIRDSIICLDKKGIPLRSMILWLDKRKTEHKKKLPLLDRLIYLVAGMKKPTEMIREISAVNWIREYEPEIWEKTDKIVLLSTYIHFKLCGKLIDSTARVMSHLPYDNKKRRWMKKGELNYVLFPVEPEKLCELVEPGDILGEISQTAASESGIPAGLPLVATGSDKGCETLGLGCTSPEKLALSFGTIATAQRTCAKYVESQRYFPAYVSPLKGHYNPEVEVYRGYWLISWFIKEFAEKEQKEALEKGVSAEEILNERLKEIPPGCDGLIFQPYFTPGVSMPVARGAITGFSDFHTRVHIYRSIIEGINFALMDGINEFERRTGMRSKELYLAGGGSQSSEICQITADMFGLPAYRTQTHEASSIGSAMVTFTALGYFENMDEALAKMVHIKDVFMPDMENHALYAKLYREVFTHIFAKLQPLYSKLGHIMEA